MSASEPEIQFELKPPPVAEVYISTAKPKPPLTDEEWADLEKPKVLIVGAGIGGLMLGNFLQKGGIPFQIFERMDIVKPLGSCMSIGGVFGTLFEQIGILDDLKAIGKLNIGLEYLREDLSRLLVMDTSERLELTGSNEYLVARPELYNLLLRQIPKEKIHMSKKVLSFMQNEDGVMIRCADNQTHHGDILVGADGAHSAVRQHLYKELKQKKILPPSDDIPLPFNCVCLVGQTEVLDPEEFPDLNLPHSKFNTVVGILTSGTQWVRATTKQNTVCWIVVRYLTKETSKQHDSFRNSEWGPEAAEAMCKEVRDFKVPGGREGKVTTIGDLIDRTPKHLISKVMLEEKIFHTWFGGRTVLLGDACHKLNPAGGAGALTAIQDAVALANWICALQSKKASEIEDSFKEYHAERYPLVKQSYETSKMFNHIAGKSFASMVVRAVFKKLPRFLWRKILIKRCSVRPQLSFLPLVEDKGTAPPIYQASLHKTLEILKRRAEDQAKGASSISTTVAV
ncbi:hypothetical protein BGZ93_007368 [Podila epicladia]|nr:hypothetical protein BGZ92_002911 [Podila epicladia]KAG0099492.1 hypothetical protein BGZ93_007368 [Podila epicladia]